MRSLFFVWHALQVRRSIVLGLRLRGVNVLTAQEDGTRRLPDAELLDRADSLGRVLFSHDHDLLREAARRQSVGIRFSGVIFAEQTALTVGQCIRELELVAKILDPEEMVSRVEFLPLG